jgi:Colicin V production protein
MTIWILALVLLASEAGLGFSQGAIRAAISFIGIVIAALFAGLLGKLFRPLFPHLGLQNPALIWMLGPLVAFIIILIVFKVGGFFVHRKIYLFYKYQAGDLRLAIWKRINSRLGGCVGLLNGTAYLLLICFAIYNFSYWTIQTALSSNEPVAIRVVNKMGHDLDATGMAGASRSLFAMPEMYYKLADLAGLLRQNPQLKGRLEDYPAFLSLAENDDLKSLGQNSDFQDAWKNRAPITQLMNNAQAKKILQNKNLTATILNIVQTNWNDLNTYLKTGKSPSYASVKILGRWNFNADVSVGMLLLVHPNISAAEIKALRSLWSNAYAQTVFIAAADHQAFLENLPRFTVQKGMTTVAEKLNFQGQWQDNGTNYDVLLNGNGPQKAMTAHTDGLRLTLKSDSDSWVFDHE